MIDLWLDQPDWITIGVLGLAFSLSGALFCCLSFLPAFRHQTASFQGVVGPFFTSSGALFALMTAFLGSSVYDAASTANETVMRERQGAIEIIDLARALRPHPAITRLPDLTRAYLHAVIEHEWNVRTNRLGSPITEQAYAQLLAEIAGAEVAQAGGGTMQAALLRAAQDIHAARLTRLSLQAPRGDGLRWVTVLLLGLLTQASIAVVHLDRLRSQILALTLSTLATVITLGLIAITERPFDGALGVSPEPLRQVIGTAS